MTATGLWADGDAYERWIGRWSRPVGVEFLAWLGQPDGRRWLDLGSGTGALTETILATDVCRLSPTLVLWASWVADNMTTFSGLRRSWPTIPSTRR